MSVNFTEIGASLVLDGSCAALTKCWLQTQERPISKIELHQQSWWSTFHRFPTKTARIRNKLKGHRELRKIIAFCRRGRARIEGTVIYLPQSWIPGSLTELPPDRDTHERQP